MQLQTFIGIAPALAAIARREKIEEEKFLLLIDEQPEPETLSPEWLAPDYQPTNPDSDREPSLEDIQALW